MTNAIATHTPGAVVLGVGGREFAPLALMAEWLLDKTDKTRITYTGAVRAFARFVGHDEETALGGLLAADTVVANRVLRLWRAHMKGEAGGTKRAANTVNLRLAAISSFMYFAHAQGATTAVVKVKREPARTYRDTRGSSEEDVAKMLAACGGDARDVTLFLCLVVMGWRAAEVVGVNIGDLDLDGRRVWITGKARVDSEPITIPAALRSAFARLLDDLGDDDRAAPLFRSRGGPNETLGRRLTEHGLWDWVVRLSRRAGAQRAHPHKLRHTAITSAVKAGASLLDVMRYARHVDPRVTTRYIDNLNDVGGQVADAVADRLLRPLGETAYPSRTARGFASRAR